MYIPVKSLLILALFITLYLVKDTSAQGWNWRHWPTPDGSTLVPPPNNTWFGTGPNGNMAGWAWDPNPCGWSSHFPYVETHFGINCRIQSIKTIYQHVIWPNPSPTILSNGSTLNGAFAPGVSGRINTIGELTSHQDTIEYFYALAGPINGILTFGSPYCIGVDYRVLDVVNNRASVDVNLLLVDFGLENSTIRNITHTGWFTFNDNGTVKGYDITLLRLDQLNPVQFPPSEAPLIIENICLGCQAICVGVNQQFDNVSDCITFMNSIAFGGLGNLRSNSVACRSIHLALAPVRPYYHCWHVGPSGGVGHTGGGKCIDVDYSQWFLDEFVTDTPGTIQWNFPPPFKRSEPELALDAPVEQQPLEVVPSDPQESLTVRR